jgi:trimethylamine-N-oxide reductase (cytochrome c)
LGEFNDKKYFVPPISSDWKDDPPGVRLFYENPTDNPLQTDSGLIEFYADKIAENFPDDDERGPLAKWVVGGPGGKYEGGYVIGWTHDESLWGERCKDYPLIIVSNHCRWRHHVQHDGQTWLREIPTCKIVVDGYAYEPVWINPVNADERGIVHGDIVKVFNERGICPLCCLCNRKDNTWMCLCRSRIKARYSS